MCHHVGLVAQVLRFMKTFKTECHSEFAPCFQHCECWGWKLWNQPTGHIPKCVPQSWPRKPTFWPFSDPFIFTSLPYLFVTRMTLMFRFWLGDSHMLQSVCVAKETALKTTLVFVMKDKIHNDEQILEYIFSLNMWALRGRRWPTNYLPKLCTIAISFRK